MGKYNKNANTNLLYMISDCFFGFIAYFLCGIICKKMGIIFSSQTFMVYIIYTVVYVLINRSYELYNTTLFFYTDRIIKLITKATIFSILIILLIFYAGNIELNRRYYIIFYSIHYIFMLFSAFITHHFMKNIKLLSQRSLMIGRKEQYVKFCDYLDKGNMDVNIIGYVSETDNEDKGGIGHIGQLEELIHKNAIDQVFFNDFNLNSGELKNYIGLCMKMGVTARVIMQPYTFQKIQNYTMSVGTYPVITYHSVDLNIYSRVIKRMMDIVGSLVGIILFSPFMLIAAIAIKLDSKGPVIFKQKRVGKNGRIFHIYKFRSMCIDAEEKKNDLMKKNGVNGNVMFKMENDPRVTKVGQFIRKTSIDELPQFFNVLIGTMSLVGTRPPTLDEVEKYETEHWRRISIKPGITGNWQVSGRSKITDFEQVVQLDTEYIDKWSIVLDIKIIIKTALQMVRPGSGAY